MTDTITIDALTAADIEGVEQVLATSGLFPPELLAPMAAPYLAGGSPDLWLVARRGPAIAGFTYTVPERMTEGTWNLLAIAVDGPSQGKGIGAVLVRHLEHMLTNDGQRLLLVETSALDEYAATRRFYLGLGYSNVARIPEFYQAGEDKLVFCRMLASPSQTG